MIKRISIPAIAAAIAMAATGINPAFAATKPPVGTEINISHALANGLVGCWLFNENSGNTANDSTSSGNDGTLVGDTS